jgi:hypothetical protein
VHDYEERLATTCVPVGRAVNAQIACVTPMMVHHDEDEAIRRGLEGGNFFGYSLAHFYIFGDHRPGVTNVWEEYLERRDKMGYSPEAAIAERRETLGAKFASGGASGLRGAVGTPDQLRDYMRRYEEAGVDELIFILQAGKNQHEHIMEAIELFGTEVLPEFAERDEAFTKAKQERLAPVIEAAMARKVETAPPMPKDFVMRAIPKQMAEAAGNDSFNQLIEKVADDSAAGGGALSELAGN